MKKIESQTDAGEFSSPATTVVYEFLLPEHTK